jgi:hypothetical protein
LTQGGFARNRPLESGFGDVPNVKVFRKQTILEHLSRPVVAYARTVYLERSVDADEFIRYDT